MSKPCRNCGVGIPLGRGQKNNNPEVHAQVKYCSPECRIEYQNEVWKKRQRLFPDDTLRHDAIRLAGAAAESIATASLLVNGFEVYKPVTATGRNDLVVCIDGAFYRVQVKSVRRRRKLGNLVNNYAWRLDDRYFDILANVVLTENSVEFTPALDSFLKKQSA